MMGTVCGAAVLCVRRGTHFVRVRAQNMAGKGSWSLMTQFDVDCGLGNEKERERVERARVAAMIERQLNRMEEVMIFSSCCLGCDLVVCVLV